MQNIELFQKIPSFQQITFYITIAGKNERFNLIFPIETHNFYQLKTHTRFYFYHTCLLSKSIISSTIEPTSPYTQTSNIKETKPRFVCKSRMHYPSRTHRMNNEQILARRPFQCVHHYLTFFFEPPITVTVHCSLLTSRRFPAFDK